MLVVYMYVNHTSTKFNVDVEMPGDLASIVIIFHHLHHRLHVHEGSSVGMVIM